MGGLCQVILLALACTIGVSQGKFVTLDSSEPEQNMTSEKDHEVGSEPEYEVASEPYHNVTKREVVPYIIGGTITPVKTAVAIMIKGKKAYHYKCAGTIISVKFVVTAAHCILNDESNTNILVVAGESNISNYLQGISTIATEHGVKRVIKHPNYFTEPGEQFIWDFALIELSTKITIDGKALTEAALLPPPGMRFNGRKVRVGGWGITEKRKPSAVHLAIDIPIRWGRECGDIYEGVGKFFPNLMMCGGKSGMTTCDGDSGAGVIYNGWSHPIVIAVVSYGDLECTTASVYQRIEKVLPWIAKETKLRPTYDVFDEEKYFQDYLTDMKVPSPTCQPSKRTLFNTINGGKSVEDDTIMVK